MQIKIGLNFTLANDGTNNTFTLKIADLCLALNIADITPIVDAVVPAVHMLLADLSTATGTATLNSRGTAFTVVFASTPPAEDGTVSVQFLHNV